MQVHYSIICIDTGILKYLEVMNTKRGQEKYTKRYIPEISGIRYRHK